MPTKLYGRWILTVTVPKLTQPMEPFLGWSKATILIDLSAYSKVKLQLNQHGLGMHT